jgi:hypothetical protein
MLVRCPSCKETLVQPGDALCSDCKRERRKAERPRPEPKPEPTRPNRPIPIPSAPHRDDMAAHRRVRGDGRRWR